MTTPKRRSGWRRTALQLVPFGLMFAIIAGASVWFIVLRPPLSRGFGPEARAMECRFDHYCRGDACNDALPEPALIVLNGYLGRSYMIWGKPLGQATVVQREAGSLYAARLDNGRLGVFDVAADRSFAFRMTARLIDGPGIELGSGHCAAPAPMPQTG